MKSPDEPSLRIAVDDKSKYMGMGEFVVCASESEKAERLKDSPRRFYFDFEMIEAGVDPIFGVASFGFLKEDWREHKAGALAFSAYTGMTDALTGKLKDRPTVTWVIEVV
jgi:hypothetical protein